MKTALVTGASGLVGSLLTKKLLSSDYYDKIIALVRKPLDNNHPKLEQVIFDFDYPDMNLVKADDIYSCLGTTIGKAGSKNEFEKVDLHYPAEIGFIALKNGAQKFALVSSMGANHSSKFYYNRIKGETERAIKKLNYSTLLIFRPSMLLGKRNEFRLGEKVGKVFMNGFSFMIPSKYKAIHAGKVAEAMISNMTGNLTGTHIISSEEMQKYHI